jgi:hypothetical protein
MYIFITLRGGIMFASPFIIKIVDSATVTNMPIRAVFFSHNKSALLQLRLFSQMNSTLRLAMKNIHVGNNSHRNGNKEKERLGQS